MDEDFLRDVRSVQAAPSPSFNGKVIVRVRAADSMGLYHEVVWCLGPWCEFHGMDQARDNYGWEDIFRVSGSVCKEETDIEHFQRIESAR